MSEEVKVYQFNEYILSYDKSERDRSCLTISKTQNGNIYVMSELLDGSADVVSMILDSLQTTVNYCKQENKKYKEVIDKLKELIIDNIEETTYEYIGSNKIKVLQKLIMDNDGVNELLDILKEVE